ncbi:MAG: murein L,D-transpeptidase, partial [Lentisphaerae bacterium]|nr:murein L,D-transpeptidase [Lentisphaerota bacterium]
DAHGMLPAPDEMLQTPAPTPTPFKADGRPDQTVMDIIANESFSVYQRDVSAGNIGEEAFRIQRRLGQLGYLAATADGNFGRHSDLALKYFQRRNGLPETGIADETTQKLLYSYNAAQSDQYVSQYMAVVDVSDQRVYIFMWTGAAYDTLTKTMVCSTGTEKDPTTLGTFQAAGRMSEWYYFDEYDVYARWVFIIHGGEWFHSVLYHQQGGVPTGGSVKKLGQRDSHGCIRLAVDEAKWIYENCSNGMTVIVQD